jgi:hypothetical protein
MGTMRLAVAFGAGFVGILYLLLAITPLASGQIEVRPTPLSIDMAEADGFPEPWYLEITGGYIVFSEGDVQWEDEDAEERELRRLTVPVVSAALLEDWNVSAEEGDSLDASQFRLLASFNGEQVARLWPEVMDLIEDDQSLEVPPVRMALVGDTEPAKFMVYKPYEFEEHTKNFDWEKVRWLRFERHFQSPGRFVKNLLVGIGLLLIAVAVFRHHRRRPDDVATDVFDWSAVPDELDIDLD